MPSSFEEAAHFGSLCSKASCCGATGEGKNTVIGVAIELVDERDNGTGHIARLGDLENAGEAETEEKVAESAFVHAIIVEGGSELGGVKLNGLEPGALALEGALEIDETANAFVEDIAEMVCAAKAGGGCRDGWVMVSDG